MKLKCHSPPSILPWIRWNTDLTIHRTAIPVWALASRFFLIAAFLSSRYASFSSPVSSAFNTLAPGLSGSFMTGSTPMSPMNMERRCSVWSCPDHPMKPTDASMDFTYYMASTMCPTCQTLPSSCSCRCDWRRILLLLSVALTSASLTSGRSPFNVRICREL